MITIPRFLLWIIIWCLLVYAIPAWVDILESAFAEIPDEEPNYTWAWTEKEGYFKVYWLAFEEEYEKYNEWKCKPNEVACGDTLEGNVHVIYYRESTMFNETIPGCNVWTHENLHHWGYNEEMIRDFFPCDQPSKYKTLPHIGTWK